MSLVSKLYSTRSSLSPINKQAAKGCQENGSSYDESPFHPLAGKGCLDWALKNCRETESIQELIYKIAAGCDAPVLQVAPMVNAWIESGRAVWREGRLFVRKNKPTELSDTEKRDVGLHIIARLKLVPVCCSLRGKVKNCPQFYIGDLGRGDYDVAIQEGNSLIAFSDWVNSLGAECESLRGPLNFVSAAVLLLRDEFPSLVGLEAKQGPKAGTIYSVANPTDKTKGKLRSLMRPMPTRKGLGIDI